MSSYLAVHVASFSLSDFSDEDNDAVKNVPGS